MSRILQEMKHKDGNFIYPPPLLPPPPSTSSSSIGRIKTSQFLLIIVILAVIFFISGIVHLLIRYLKKRPSSSLPIHQSNRYTENPSGLQRQLQQLFKLHDSGLDQTVIDSLPVFYYKSLMGLKEPFDCAVCLCEFSEDDKLKLLPMCGHAFHVTCIDTWLLSNSTCPLCRGSGFPMEGNHPVSSFEVLREISNGYSSDGEKPHVIMEEEEGNGCSKRVFSVRLGKFRSINDGEGGEGLGETSRCNLDARRCYSMGTFQYVVGDTDLQVALSHEVEMEEEKKINGRSRGDSFSVSKIWLWSSRKSNTHLGVPSLSYSKFSNQQTQTLSMMV